METTRTVRVPVEVEVPVPVVVMPDSLFMTRFVEVWDNHVDFRAAADTTEDDAVRKTLLELGFRKSLILAVYSHFRAILHDARQEP